MFFIYKIKNYTSLINVNLYKMKKRNRLFWPSTFLNHMTRALSQTLFAKVYQRKPVPSGDVVLLQDVKDLVFYLLGSAPIGLELLGFLHLGIVDRFLRALILYMQAYLTTWAELSEMRAASAKRVPNPLAGGARVDRAYELKALRCILAREYVDLITGWQPEITKYHHAGAGQTSFAQSSPEKDFRCANRASHVRSFFPQFNANLKCISPGHLLNAFSMRTHFIR